VLRWEDWRGVLGADEKRVALETGKCWEDPGGAICSPLGLLGKGGIGEVGMPRRKSSLVRARGGAECPSVEVPMAMDGALGSLAGGGSQAVVVTG